MKKTIICNGFEGLSVCFTSGAGNDWIAYGEIEITNFEFDDFIHNPGEIYKSINDHHQLRWLAEV